MDEIKELTAEDRPDETGAALLQSLHVLNEFETYQINSMNIGKELDVPVHYYAWGLFKTTLLKATKDRLDLQLWSPEIFKDYKKCGHCDGNGRNAIPHDSQQYKDILADEDFWAKEREDAGYPFEEPFIKPGENVWNHCTPCQGSGVLTKLDIARGK